MQRYSLLFGKTNKSAKEYDSVNATLLQKGGFIDQEMAGVYSFLPLGLRVLNKIENIVREEMNKIGQEILMPVLSPQEYWEKTGRLETMDVLLKATAANDVSRTGSSNEYIVNATHEEVVTPLAQSFNKSYKSFPFSLYQIQNKFRNEARPKSGILRGREFRMKDMYSFHTSEEDMLAYYEKAKDAYMNVYNRLGLGEDTYITAASGGDFTDNFSHEFQTLCEVGEDTLYHVASKDLTFNEEIAPSKASALDHSGVEKKPMEEVLGEGIIGVEPLAEFLGISVADTTKTMIYETDDGQVIAAAVRGGYEINELKLKKIIGCKRLQLASEETVKRVTNSEVGYAGLIGLADDVRIIMDDSMEGRKNFEMGTNKTNYHTINVNFGRDIDLPEQFYDIKVVKEGDTYPETGEQYDVLRSSEVGNIFPLDTKYSKAFGYTFTNENGEEELVSMGCYGIGITRAMGIIVEKFHDDNGIIWPKNIAPFEVHLITIGDHDDEAMKLIASLEKEGMEVLWDERETRPGEKFADADLIGCPVRIVLSDRSLENGGVEMKERSAGEAEMVGLSDVVEKVKGKLEIGN